MSTTLSPIKEFIKGVDAPKTCESGSLNPSPYFYDRIDLLEMISSPVAYAPGRDQGDVCSRVTGNLVNRPGIYKEIQDSIQHDVANLSGSQRVELLETLVRRKGLGADFSSMSWQEFKKKLCKDTHKTGLPKLCVHLEDMHKPYLAPFVLWTYSKKRAKERFRAGESNRPVVEISKGSFSWNGYSEPAEYVSFRPCPSSTIGKGLEYNYNLQISVSVYSEDSPIITPTAIAYARIAKQFASLIQSNIRTLFIWAPEKEGWNRIAHSELNDGNNKVKWLANGKTNWAEAHSQRYCYDPAIAMLDRENDLITFMYIYDDPAEDMNTLLKGIGLR